MRKSFKQIKQRIVHSLNMSGNNANTPSSTNVLDRAIGCLYGQATGDALGTRYEFMPPTKAKQHVQRDTRADDHFLPILGGGPFSMECGQVTDDTEMAMALARSVLRCRRFDGEDVARAYHDWYKSNPPDIGNTTRRALYNVNRAAGDVYGQMVKNANEHNRESKSNGCLMRISPLAIALAGADQSTLAAACLADTSITHSDPMTRECVLVYTTALAALIRGATNKEAYELAVTTAQHTDVQQLLVTAELPVPDNATERSDGYVGVAFMLAFRHLLQSDNIQSALIHTIRMGGDTDTNGCIVGAMMGASQGWQSVPKEWRMSVVNAKPRRLKYYPVVALNDLDKFATKLLQVTVPLDKAELTQISV